MPVPVPFASTDTPASGDPSLLSLTLPVTVFCAKIEDDRDKNSVVIPTPRSSRFRNIIVSFLSVWELNVVNMYYLHKIFFNKL